MDVVSARIRYRPVRIGWCIGNDDFESLRKAIRTSFCFWGGNFFPIIPFENKQLSDQLIKSFKVDVLFPMTENSNSSALKFIGNYDFIKWPLIHPMLFEPRIGGRITPNFLDINFPATEYSKRNYLGKSLNILLVNHDKDDPLRDIISIDFGAIAEPINNEIDYYKQLEKYFEVNEYKFEKNQNIYLNEKIFSISRLAKSFLYASNFHYTWFEGFYVGQVNKFEDLVNYWNLKASNIRVKFFDQNYSKRFSSINDSIENLKLRNKSDDFSPEHLTFWYGENKFNKEIGNAKSIHLNNHFWNSYTQPTIYHESKTVMGYKSANSNTLNLPINDLPKISNNEFSNLIFEYDVYSDSTFQNELVYNVPYIPELNSRYGSKLVLNGLALRVGSEFDGMIDRSSTNTLTVFPLRVEELIDYIFSLFGLKISLSKPGLIVKQIVRQFKGLAMCKIFRLDGIRNLLNNTSAKSPLRKTEAIKLICNGNFTDKFQLFLQEYTPNAIFEELLKIGIFRVGLEIGCPSCQLKFWKSIDEIKNDIICEYCGNEIILINQIKDRDWFYRKSGILTDDLEGAIPTILTLVRLNYSLDRGKNFYFPSFEIMNLPKSKIIEKKIELDFIYINQRLNSSPNIAIGECKTNSNFDRTDLDNLLRVKNILEKKQIDVYIILSKLSELTKDELSLVTGLEEQIKSRLIIFTKDELEEEYVFHRKAERFEINKYAMTLEEMARNTQIIYFSHHTL